jgi:hypothetical protein
MSVREVMVTLDRPRPYEATTRAMVLAESVTPGLRVLQGVDVYQLTHVRGLLYGGLNAAAARRQDDSLRVTLEQVEDIIDDIGLDVAFEIVIERLAAAFPTREDAVEMDPPAPAETESG